jgi:hypothetical protein
VKRTIWGRFTLWPKVERTSTSTNQLARNQEFCLATLHTKVVVDLFFIKVKKNDKILAVRVEGLFWAGNKVGRSFFLWTLELGLWRLHTMAVQAERPWEFMAKGLEFGLDLWKLCIMHD